MADPYNAKEVIVEIVNQSDGLNITVAEVNFSNPVRAIDVLPIKNTSVVLTPITSSGFYGKKTVYYNRIHISEAGAIVVARGAANNHVALLPAINTKYGLYLTTDDIIDHVIPAGQTGDITVPLEINPNSLTWYDGAVIVTA